MDELVKVHPTKKTMQIEILLFLYINLFIEVVKMDQHLHKNVLHNVL